MTVKIIKVHTDQEPIIMGIDRLPASYQAPARRMIKHYAYLMTACKPYHLGSLSECVKEVANTTEIQVDADLLADFHEASCHRKPGLGGTLYRLDAEMLPV